MGRDHDVPSSPVSRFSAQSVDELDDQARKLVNKSIDRALRNGAVGMRVNMMDLGILYIADYSDASLANNFDLPSQISGLIVFQDFLGNAALSQ